MMSTKQNDVLVRFGADIDPLKKGAKEASRSLEDVQKRVLKASKAAIGLGAAASTAGTAIGVKLVSASMQAVDAQAKLAKQLNTSSKSMANLKLASNLAGVSFDQISAASKALDVRLAEAVDGVGEAAGSLKELGITSEELINLDLDEKISRLNKAITENIEPTRQAAIAADLFGSRAGAAVRQLDPDTLSFAAGEIERLGLAISDVDAAKIEAANDAITLMKMSLNGVVERFTVELSPAIKAAADAIREDMGGASDSMSDGVQVAAKIAVGSFADVLDGGAELVDFVSSNKDIAKYGIMGYMIFGKKGALIGAAIASTFKMVTEPLQQMGIMATEAVEPINQEIEILEGKLGNVEKMLRLLDWGGVSPDSDAYNDLIDQASLLQLRISDLKSSIVAGSDAEAEFNRLMAEGADNGINLAETMRNVADSLRDVHSAMGETPEGLPKPESDEESDIESDPEVDRARKINEAKAASYLSFLEKRQSAESRANKVLEEMDKAAMKNRIKDADVGLSAISSLMESENKKAFRVGQAAAITQTGIDTVTAAQAAYKSLAGIPIVGPALGAAAAGAATLQGLRRVQQIRSTSFGSSPAASTGGGSSVAAPVSTPAATSAAENKTLTLEGFNPNSLYKGDQLMGLIDALRDAQNDGYEVVVS